MGPPSEYMKALAVTYWHLLKKKWERNKGWGCSAAEVVFEIRSFAWQFAWDHWVSLRWRLCRGVSSPDVGCLISAAAHWTLPRAGWWRRARQHFKQLDFLPLIKRWHLRMYVPHFECAVFLSGQDKNEDLNIIMCQCDEKIFAHKAKLLVSRDIFFFYCPCRYDCDDTEVI